MRLLRRSAAVIVAAILLAGCGGGGSTPSAVPKPAATASSAGSSTARTNTVGKLTVKYSAHFHTAKGLAKATSGTTRKPAYVNSNGQYLDVWVVTANGASHVVDSTGGSNVSPGVDGSQTFSIPLLSSDNNQIVAYETDQPYGSYGNLLSLGESDIGSFTAGTAPVIPLTMSMNAVYAGVMGDPDNAQGDATVGSTYYSYNSYCTTPFTFGTLYFFAADQVGGFVDLAGAGGLSLPTLKSWTSDDTGPANSLAQGPGVAGGYNVTVNNNNLDGVTVHLTTANPAYPIALDAYYGNNQYPAIDYLYNNYYTYDYNFYYHIYYTAIAGPSFNSTIDLRPSNGC